MCFPTLGSHEQFPYSRVRLRAPSPVGRESEGRPERLSPPMARTYDASPWAAPAAKFGRIRRHEMQEGFHVVMLTSVFADGTFDLQIVMADDLTVARFFLRPPS